VGGLVGRPIEEELCSDRRPAQQVTVTAGNVSRVQKPTGSRVTSGRQFGFVAQQVEKVFPTWVGQDAKGYKTLQLPFGFSALTVEAIRALKGENDQLRADNAQIRLQLADLKERLDALERTQRESHERGQTGGRQ
jgi:hypothetical protein